MKKRLYTVTATVTALVVADSEYEAENFLEWELPSEMDLEAASRLCDNVPDEWLDGVPYGDAEDKTCAEWFECQRQYLEERAREKEAERDEHRGVSSTQLFHRSVSAPTSRSSLSGEYA